MARQQLSAGIAPSGGSPPFGLDLLTDHPGTWAGRGERAARGWEAGSSEGLEVQQHASFHYE